MSHEVAVGVTRFKVKFGTNNITIHKQHRHYNIIILLYRIMYNIRYII